MAITSWPGGEQEKHTFVRDSETGPNFGLGCVNFYVVPKQIPYILVCAWWSDRGWSLGESASFLFFSFQLRYFIMYRKQFGANFF